MKILVVNSGSSSQKLSLYEFSDTLPEEAQPGLWEKKIEWHGDNSASSSQANALKIAITSLWTDPKPTLTSPTDIDIVGHRIVHGGPQYREPVRITDEVKSGIAAAAAIAPLHNRAELDGIEVVRTLLGDIPQVAVFDTGFHRTIPPAAAVYPGPYEWFTQGIRRYGFHGINHQYCGERAAQLLKRDLKTLKLVTCHLGNGCSLAAIRNGESMDTTMGFTPLEGVMMGTRSGSIDPGILTYLLRQGRLQPGEIDNMLNRQSGLLGVSGLSEDMREILAHRKQGHFRAALAFDMYTHRLQAGIGAMAAVLGGIDALIFSGGVGENSSEVRDAACRNLSFIGVSLDAHANEQRQPDADIATANSSARVLLIRAQEDWAIARACWRLAAKTGLLT